MRQFVESAVAIFRANPDATEDEILDRVVESGIERSMAVQLVALLPIAYGRVSLSDVRGVLFSGDYICLGEEGQRDRHGRLNSLPVWEEAMAFAKHEASIGLAGQARFTIASRSAEMRAINAALRDGKKLENLNLIMSPPGFLWPVDALKKPRPWWQIWT